MSGVLDELFEDGAANDAAPAASEVAVSPQSEPVIAPAPEAPAPQAAPVQQAPTQQPVERSVPLPVLLDERDKRKQYEAQARELQAQLDELNRKREEAESQLPNVLDDPDGYHQAVMRQARQFASAEAQRIAREQVQRAIAEDRLVRSEEHWRQQLGDKWGEFNAWLEKAPQNFHNAAMGQRDPYGFAKAEFDRQQKLRRAEEWGQKIGDKSLDDYIAEQVAAKLAETQAVAAANAQDRPRNERGQFAPSTSPEPQRHRPKSLNEMNGAAVVAPSAPGSALDELYG